MEGWQIALIAMGSVLAFVILLVIFVLIITGLPNPAIKPLYSLDKPMLTREQEQELVQKHGHLPLDSFQCIGTHNR